MTQKFSRLLQNKTKKTKLLKITAAVFALLILIVITKGTLASKSQSPNQSQTSPSNNKSQQLINLDNSIDISIGTKEEETISYKLVSAELTDQIILKGQKATAVEGKKFLIINLKLSNTQEKRVKLDTRDYLRLTIEGSEDRLAPSMYNDPVELQPISDQNTRIGFSVPDNATNMKLFLGPISEDKTEIDLNF